MNIPEFVFNTEKLKIINPKASENIFDNNNYKSPIIISRLDKNSIKENNHHNNNSNLSIINHKNINNNEIQNQSKVNLVNAKVSTSEKLHKDNQLAISRNTNFENKNNSKGIFNILIKEKIELIHLCKLSLINYKVFIKYLL